MNRAYIVIVFSVLIMFTGFSHVISSHVATDCGAHKPTNPECPVIRLVLALYATIDQFV